MVQLSSKAIAPDVLDVLREASAEDNLLYLGSGQLDRKLYTDTNKVITALGGKWNGGKVAAHVFDEGTDVAGLLEIVLEKGLAPEKNPLAFFRSTPAVVSAVESAIAELNDEFLFALEPSCGDGALLHAIQRAAPSADITAVEIDAKRAKAAKSLGIAKQVDNCDFLHWAITAKPRYGVIGMNPPFSVKGDRFAYATHISKAYELLAFGGRLVAIAPSGLTTSTVGRVAELRELVEHQGLFLDLPENSFQESGTGVSTVLVIIDKPRP